MSNKLERLAQENDYGVRFTDCMRFIQHSEVPKGRKVTYANFVCDHQPQKSEPWRVYLVVGGDKIDYPAGAGPPNTTLLETKLLINSVISNYLKGACFMSLDLKDFFLSLMSHIEYMASIASSFHMILV